MVIDTSALLAVLFQEPEAEQIARALVAADRRLTSAATLLETGIVVLVRHGDDGVRDLDLLAAKLQIEVAPVTEQQAIIARRAYHQFGKGRGHRAGLNFGDCFAYALAKATGQPLLFKGDDFIHTDLATVPY
jgi:ribonuclease VapC